MVANAAQTMDRVIWVGTGRQSRRGIRRFWFGDDAKEPERDWRERLAGEMNDACDEMAGQGLRLASIVPVLSSTGLQGGWTEGAWLHFARAE